MFPEYGAGPYHPEWSAECNCAVREGYEPPSVEYNDVVGGASGPGPPAGLVPMEKLGVVLEYGEEEPPLSMDEGWPYKPEENNTITISSCICSEGEKNGDVILDIERLLARET